MTKKGAVPRFKVWDDDGDILIDVPYSKKEAYCGTCSRLDDSRTFCDWFGMSWEYIADIPTTRACENYRKIRRKVMSEEASDD